MKKITRALLSVSDKTGILEVAQMLRKFDIEIISTGGTAKLLLQNNIQITEISDYTEFPEMMDGRLKTLHPRVHGGLLGRRNIDDDIMQKNNIHFIDLVIVNLYPFKETIEKEDCTFNMAIENIDIGGPTMLRSAAKNHKDVAVIPDIKYYPILLEELTQNNGAISRESKFKFACETFNITAQYEGMISNYLSNIDYDTKKRKNIFPDTLNLHFKKSANLRYGENPHQSASVYANLEENKESIINSTQLQGKELSYNNLSDTDAALDCVLSIDDPACVIVKHANPCGVAAAETIREAYQKAFQCDPTSAFGGIIAFNRKLDKLTAQDIITNQFVEVIIAPNIDPEALEVTKTKKNIRILELKKTATNIDGLELKKISGGILVQEKDIHQITEQHLTCVSERKPTSKEMKDLLFAWKVVKHVKSNAIVYAKNGMTVGIGAGQMSRVFSSKIACEKASEAKLSLNKAAMASDAFFPFRDGIDAAAKQGVTCIIQPGGSVRDQEVIDAANEHNISMVFTGMRHFKH